MGAYLRGPSLGPLRTTIPLSGRKRQRRPGPVTLGQVLGLLVMLAVVIAYIAVRA
jgi:hypothetical protein